MSVHGRSRCIILGRRLIVAFNFSRFSQYYQVYGTQVDWLPEGHSLWTAGFIQVYRFSINIYRHLPALKWFYLSIALIDAGVK